MVAVFKETHARVIGDDWAFDLTITQTDANGVVTPVTGLSSATIISTIENRDTGTDLWTGTRAGGQIVVTNDSQGKITITVPRATTATFAAQLYDMDCRVTSTAKVTPKRWYVQGLKTASA